MYVIIAGAGKVGWNLARELIAKEREVTLIESDHARYRVVEEELEHAVQYGDATELWVLERAGIQRADLVIAVTGDDEDNILICQMAKEKYGVQRIVARVNNPRNLQHFRLLDVQPAVSATDLILRLIEHEVPEYGLVQLLALEEEHLEIIELEVSQGSEAAGRRVQDVPLPDGSLIISVLRGGAGFVPKADSVIQPGDQVLLILDPGLEAQITPQFAPNGASATARDGGPARRLRADRRRPGGGQLRPVAARVGRRRVDPADRARAGPALQPAAVLEGVPPGQGVARGDAVPAAGVVRGAADRGADAGVGDTSLDVGERTVALSNGEEVSFDKALIATGADVRRVTVPGAELEGIHYLRTLGNSDAIREDAAGKRVVLIGGSYIATEVAASLTELGSTCTMVMLEPVALSRGFGEQAGRFFQDRLEEHGIEVHGEDELDSFDGRGRPRHPRGHQARAAARGRRRRGRRGGAFPTSGCREPPGSRSASTAAWWSTPGWRPRCRASSPPATSPSTRAWCTAAARSGSSTGTSPSTRARPPRSTCSARTSPTTSCRTSSPICPTGPRSSTSGPPAEWDQEVVRGSIDEGEFTIFYLHGGRVVAALAVGRSDDLEHAGRLLASGAAVQHRVPELEDLSSELAAIADA